MVWEKDQGRHWNTVAKVEGNVSVGIIVFIGVAWLNGFTDAQVIDYLSIKRERHYGYLCRFKNAIKLEQAARLNELYSLDNDSIEKRITRKYRLLENAMKMQNRGQYVNLSDIEF